MPPRDLLSWLGERAAFQDLWQIGDSRYHVEKILRHAAGLREWRDSFAGKRVAIAGRDNQFHMLAMVLLDGAADAILPLPTGLPLDVIGGFVEQAGISDLVCDSSVDAALSELFTEVHSLPEITTASSASIPQENEWSISRSTTQWLIPTSGTTGTPKLVPHTLHSLTRTTKRNLVRGSSLRWGLLYDVTRFAGLQVFLQALAGGSLLIVPPPGSSISEQITFLASHGCNALSTTPTMWRKFLMDPGIRALPLLHATLGGEIADDNILAALKTRFPGTAIRHIYASTEAGVGFSVNDGRAGFPTTFLTDPPPGLSLKIRDEDGMLLMKPAGESPVRYVDETLRIQDDEGWIETGDLVTRREDRIHFLGRSSGAINVGGAKVHPDEVESCLRQLPWVADAVVRAKRNPFSGNVVEAIVIPASDKTGDLPEKELAAAARQHCREMLDPFKVPAIVHIRESLATSSAGKVIRERDLS